MNFFNKMAEKFLTANRRLKKWQRVVSVLAAVVVFVTTYALVLPAITLDKETASTQAGMEIAASEQEPGSDGTVYEADPEEEPDEVQAESGEEEPQEESASEDSGSQEAEASEDKSTEAETEESGQETVSKEEETVPASGEASNAGETMETAEPAEEVQLITEKTQLTYQYIDENFEKDPDDDVDDGYTVYAEFGASAKLPVGVELKVKEITKESDPEAYAAYYEKALSELQDKYDENTDLSFARFYDISFVYNGEEVEPSGYVRVRIEYNKSVEVKTDENVDAVHFDKNNDEKPEVIDSEVETEKKGEDDTLKTVEFESGSFSVYGIIGSYTVDFHWEVNGKTYEFSIPGGGYVSFTDLIEVLGITGDTNSAGSEAENADNDTEAVPLTLDSIVVSEDTRKFTADVENVEFSSPELVWVGMAENDSTVGELKETNKIECEYSAELTKEQIEEINAQTVEAGDWALISMHPFTSEESLTVTMKNGDQFVVKVTDGQIRKYVISDSGETYEVIVTYDDSAEIPKDAELRVREIKDTEEKYTRNIKASNRELQSQGEPELVHPVQFDIAIVSGGEEVEPKEGSIVNVEIRLVKSLLEETVSAEKDPAAEVVDPESETEDEEDTSLFLFNGQEIALGSADLTECRITHITEDGTAEIIEDVESSVTDDKIVMQFETESFSDYAIVGVNNNNGLNDLPNTIYVGDEIYMQNCADMWVTGIGSVVTETKYDGDGYKSVRAIDTGTFRICHRNDWNNGDTGYPGQYSGKYITVLPARSEGNYPGTTPPATIDTINNASIGLTLNLFDYDLDDYLDNRFNNKDYGDHLNEFKNRGINSEHSLKFWGSGITDSSYGAQNNYVEHGVTNIVNNSLSSGYPTLKSDNTSLDYLFTPSDGPDKKVYTNVNGLFKKDGDYYVYDSNQNYAWYNPSTNSFDVYGSTYNQKLRRDGGEQASVIADKAIGFFPFHKWDDQYDLYVNWNKNLKHHFGLSMSVPFSLPKDPKAVTDTNGDPIVFDFSGDDDLWVFIDGKLAMDIGGIHQPTTGTINFKDQTVIVNGNSQSFDFSNLYDGKQHTLQVFYIERGGCDSNCKIQFNLTQYGDIHFDKVDKDNPSDKLAGAVFGIYKDEACTQPLMENLNNNTSRAYVAESDANGLVQFSDIPLGTYYLKELHAPEGYPLDNTVHTVQVYHDQTTGQVKVKVTIDGVGVEDGVKIENKKPSPIDLGLHKVWQNADGQSIVAPEGAQATFEIKRIRNYETYTEQTIEGEGRQVSHLTVGWIHNGQTHVHAEYDLIAGTQTTVSWGYKNGYEGTIGYVLNGTEFTKDPVATNIYSQAFTMPAAGGSATFYVIDNSDNGEAVTGINVAGTQFYGNEGGGVIHTFTTHTEPDPTFSYTGEHVTNNQVTLPINANTWDYIFANLPTFAKGRVDGVDHDVYFNYSYYLEEVSNNSPDGTTVVYEDSDGNVISSPKDAETSKSGTLNITNKVPVGYLRIDKVVTYNGEAPSTQEQKSALAGTYTFKVFTDENCTKPYKVIQGEAPNQQEVDLVLTITIGDDGVAKSSDKVKIPIGDYWIEEQTPVQTGVTPEENRIKVTVTEDNTEDEPAIASFTNNRTDSNNPDELAIELEKIFTGLPNASKIPANYQAALQYTLDGETVTIHLTGSTQEYVSCNKSDDGMTWHWRVTHIPAEATNFAVYESNYDITGYTRITKINDIEVDNPGTPQEIEVLKPEITMANINRDYITADRFKVFNVVGNQILLVRMTSQVTLVVSPESLSLATRQAIEKTITDNRGKIPGDDKQADWWTTFMYFSKEMQGTSFSYDGRSVFFDGNQVKIPKNASSQVVRVDINYTSTSAENSFIIKNDYAEIPTQVDVLKVEKGKETTTKLSGAVFELRKLEDVAPTPGGTLTYVKDKDGQEIVDSKTTGDDGRLTFTELTYGVYEIREVSTPPGYVKAEDVIFYLRVDGGRITYVQKGSGKPSEWTEAPNSDPTATVYYMAAQDAVEDDPSTSEIETAAAVNATFRVSNTPGAVLPNAGGPGTKLFTILGVILIAGAGVLLLKRCRMAKVFTVLSICLILSMTGMTVLAAGTEIPDLDRNGSLSITFSVSGEPISDGNEVGIYKVADAVEDEGYKFVYRGAFAEAGEMPENLDTVNEELALKLEKIAEDRNVPMYTSSQKLDENGKVTFSDLEVGLYLIVHTKKTEITLKDKTKVVYTINPFLVSIPQNKDGKLIYDVASKPKVSPEKKVTPPKKTPPPKRIPQTGQLWWPVMALSVAGAVSVTFGLIRKMKSR